MAPGGRSGKDGQGGRRVLKWGHGCIRGGVQPSKYTRIYPPTDRLLANTLKEDPFPSRSRARPSRRPPHAPLAPIVHQPRQQCGPTRRRGPLLPCPTPKPSRAPQGSHSRDTGCPDSNATRLRACMHGGAALGAIVESRGTRRLIGHGHEMRGEAVTHPYARDASLCP